MEQLDQKLSKYTLYRILKATTTLPFMIVVGCVLVVSMSVAEAWVIIKGD